MSKKIQNSKKPSKFVIHYKPNEDIQVIGGDLDYESLKLLPNCLDRVLAARYFCTQMEKLAENGQVDEAKWCFRASLTETRSITELFPAELGDVSAKKVWERSDIKHALEDHLLLSVLKKARDLSVHTAKLTCTLKDQRVVFIPEGERNVTGLFIDPIPSATDYKTSDIPKENVEWFNRQTANLPAHFIIQEAVFVICVALANFLAAKEKDLGVRP